MVFIKKTTERGENIILKKELKVMITQNLDVENGFCNGPQDIYQILRK